MLVAALSVVAICLAPALTVIALCLAAMVATTLLRPRAPATPGLRAYLPAAVVLGIVVGLAMPGCAHPQAATLDRSVQTCVDVARVARATLGQYSHDQLEAIRQRATSLTDYQRQAAAWIARRDAASGPTAAIELTYETCRTAASVRDDQSIANMIAQVARLVIAIRDYQTGTSPPFVDPAATTPTKEQTP